ncbi:MAG TPA: class I SAM-dependent methyltransferase [Nanoarchaeota archaeon]|nr:class I SAM-dependent methyltransferase [Nanoarchaeota archaeon]
MRAKIQGKNAIKKYYQDEEVASKYIDQRYSSSFGKLEHELECMAINSLLAQIRPDKILDLAAGTGRVASCLRHYKQGFAIDTSREMLNAAKPLLKGWALKTGDAFNIPFRNNCFEAIISTRFIWYFDKAERKALFKAIHSKLNAHGFLIFDAPNAKVPRFVPEKARIGKKRIYTQSWAISALEKELRANGFGISAVKPISRNAELLHRISEQTDSVLSYCVMKLINRLSRKEPYTYIILARKI